MFRTIIPSSPATVGGWSQRCLLALAVSVTLFAAACGDGEGSDIFVTFDEPMTDEFIDQDADAADASSASLSIESAEPTPTPVLASSYVAETVVPPTPEPLPTLVPRKAPEPEPTPTPSPVDGFGATDLTTDLPELSTLDTSCAAISTLEASRQNWDLLRSNTISDIRNTISGADEGGIGIALLEAQGAAGALGPHIGPILFEYDTAIDAAQGQGRDLLVALRQAEESSWQRVPATIAQMIAAPEESANDTNFTVLASLDSEALNVAKADITNFSAQACVAGAEGSIASSILSEGDAEELAAICAQAAADPEAAQFLEALGDGCP